MAIREERTEGIAIVMGIVHKDADTMTKLEMKAFNREKAQKLVEYLHSKVDRELPVEENNMGNISKAEVIDFFTYVTNDLGVVIALEFTLTAPSIYLRKTPKILFCEKDLNGYKWQVKERVLHEIAHHFEVGKRCHGTNFYRAYAELVNKYLAGYEAVE